MAPAPHPTGLFEVRIEGANCPQCLEATKSRLRAEDGVTAVSSSMSGPCLKIEHHGLARQRLSGILQDQLHGWDVALNREIVIVTITPEVADLHCGP